MSNWMPWIAAAVLLVILEIFTGTFYLLMLAIGLLAGALAAAGGLSAEWQFVLAAVVGLCAIAALHRSRLGNGAGPDAQSDPNVNIDIGQTVRVDAWRPGNGGHVARATYRGALWDIDLAAGAEPRTGTFVIRAVHGSRLVVANAN